MPLAGSHLKGNLDAFCVIDTDNSLPASQHIVQLGLVSGSRESIFGFLKARFRLVKAKMQPTKPGPGEHTFSVLARQQYFGKATILCFREREMSHLNLCVFELLHVLNTQHSLQLEPTKSKVSAACNQGIEGISYCGTFNPQKEIS